MHRTPSLLDVHPLARLRLSLLRRGQWGRGRLRRVAEGIVCGSAPDNAQLIRLAAQGVRTVVDLRRPSAATAAEAEQCAALGLEYVSVPTGDSLPDFPVVQRLLARLRNARSDQGVYLHCDFGRSRCGAVVALYRIVVQGWSIRQAGEELLRHGFDPRLEMLAEDTAFYAREMLRERARPLVPATAAF